MGLYRFFQLSLELVNALLESLLTGGAVVDLAGQEVNTPLQRFAHSGTLLHSSIGFTSQLSYLVTHLNS